MPKKSDINEQTEEAGEIQIGPTDHGMVRLFVRGESLSLPMDFEPEEARDIAHELLRAADLADQVRRPS